MSFSSRLTLTTLLCLSLLTGCGHSDQPVPMAPPATPNATGVPSLQWRVVNSYPHDPNAFTQGLLWHDGHLYEGTGLEGKSSVREVDLETGKVEKIEDVPNPIFGEGLALVKDRLYEITWKDGQCFVYDLNTFKPKTRFTYGGEGWGLTYDGTYLIQSDGTSKLTFRDPITFGARKSVNVTQDGQPVTNINELEYIDGTVWANIWQTDKIVLIDPQTGKVKAYLDMTGLLPVTDRKGTEDVLNGIAYDPKTKRIFVTGKLWPKLFQIDVQQLAQ